MEKKIERYLIEAVEHLGGLCVKFPPLFFRGFPDRIVLLPGGVIVFVETKAPGKKPGPIQRKVHARLRGLGFRVEVLDGYESIDGFILTL
jgi:hypothetical protein